MSPASAVIVAFADEPVLQDAVDAVAADPSVREVIVVDNGSHPPPSTLKEPVGALLRVIGDGSNLGFTGGANAGASAATGEVLIFVNSDAIVEAGAATALVEALADDSVGLVTGLVLLADEPSVVNAAGVAVHLGLISWADGFGEPAVDHESRARVACISGALFAARKADWDELGGFYEPMFAYHEDVELGLRTWLAGRRVDFVPQAKARHYYEFGRNSGKWYLLERNRLVTLLTVYEARTLLRLLPVVLLVEAGVWWLALKQGWGGQKAAGYRWLWRNRAELRRRRAIVQRQRVVGDEVLLQRLAPTIDPAPGFGLRVPEPVNQVFSAMAPRRRRRSVRSNHAVQ